MLTSKFDTGCPLENDGDKIELEFPFSAPNLPSAVSMTKFRYMKYLPKMKIGQIGGNITEEYQGVMKQN